MPKLKQVFGILVFILGIGSVGTIPKAEAYNCRYYGNFSDWAGLDETKYCSIYAGEFNWTAQTYLSNCISLGCTNARVNALRVSGAGCGIAGMSTVLHSRYWNVQTGKLHSQLAYKIRTSSSCSNPVLSRNKSGAYLFYETRCRLDNDCTR